MDAKFITFEGGEGTGKSTQLGLLVDFLQKKGIKAVSTKEPGGTEIGQELRRILVTGDKDKLDPTAEALLYFADRHIHMVQKVLPEMEKGNWVLSDRFADSTMAYQYYGYENAVSKENLNNLYKIAVGEFEPDLTIILDIDPEIGLARSFKKANNMEFKELRFEKKELAFHQRMRQGFLNIAKENKKRCVVFDANKKVEDLHQEIIQFIAERYGF